MSRDPAPSELVDRFVTHLQVERGASPHTVRAYSADLGRYLEWAERAHIDPVHLTHRQLRLYLAELDRARYARATVARRLSAVRSWFSYLTAEGVVDSDPSAVLIGTQALVPPAQDRARRRAGRAPRCARHLDPCGHPRRGDSRTAVRQRPACERGIFPASGRSRSGPRAAHGLREGKQGEDRPRSPARQSRGSERGLRRAGRPSPGRTRRTASSCRLADDLCRPTPSGASSSGTYTRRAVRPRSRRTRSDTPSRHTCSRVVPICAPFRSFWAMLPCLPPRFILT